MSLCEMGKNNYKETKRIINGAMNNDQLVLFVGAGASVDAGMPLWGTAIEKIADKMQLTDKQKDTLKIVCCQQNYIRKFLIFRRLL